MYRLVQEHSGNMLSLRVETHEEECDCALHKSEKCTKLHDPCTRDDTHKVIEAWPLRTNDMAQVCEETARCGTCRVFGSDLLTPPLIFCVASG